MPSPQRRPGSELALAGKLLHGAPLPFGWPTRARLARARCRIGPRRGLLAGRQDVLREGAGNLGRAPALGEARHFENAHAAIQCHGEHIAQAHRLACPIDAAAVEAHAARGGKPRGGRARAHHPRVPQPFVDPLALQADVP
jgi:hypothetical protein